jgi:hypothetical protein
LMFVIKIYNSLSQCFHRGWLENQSVWLHMSYKYYLEILRKGRCIVPLPD